MKICGISRYFWLSCFWLILSSVSVAEGRKIIIQAITPPGFSDELFICGNAEQLGSWSSHRPLIRKGEGIYMYELDVSDEQVLEFKFTRGNWGGVEKGANGTDIPNRVIKPGERKKIYAFKISGFAEGNVTKDSTLSGDVVDWPAVYSRALKNERRVLIWLPPSYRENDDRHYPVLYLHDGNNVFDAATAFGGVEWGFDETAARLMEKGEITEFIMVAVYNTEGRMEEYTPFFSVDYEGGRGRSYLHFLINDLKPQIDREFRTETAAEHTAIAGSSLGGLISLYAVYEFPQVFGQAAVVSPSLWWADRAVLDWIQKKPVPDVKIWLDMGTLEGEVTASGLPDTIVNARSLRDYLQGKGFQQGKNFYYYEAEGAGHNESAWAERVEFILRFLFPAEPSAR